MAITTVQVVVDPKLKKQLKAQAEAERRSLSQTAAILLEEALQARKSKQELVEAV